MASVLDSLADICALNPGQSLSDIPEPLRVQRLYRLVSDSLAMVMAALFKRFNMPAFRRPNKARQRPS
jgi:hypothetical protein